MGAKTVASKSASPAHAVDLHRLVGPFRESETAAWRERQRILTALSEIHDLADEARHSLDWREAISETPEADLRRAEAALRELRAQFEALWPNSGMNKPTSVN